MDNGASKFRVRDSSEMRDHQTLKPWSLNTMTPNTKKSIAASAALILLGVLVLFSGEKSLLILIPAAVWVWYAATPKLRRDRN